MACWQITRARRRRRPDFAVVASEVKSGDTVGKISRIAATIATSVAQQGSATREIARNVQNVASGTQEVASSIVEVNRSAGLDRSGSSTR
jgi:hypothetical protein